MNLDLVIEKFIKGRVNDFGMADEDRLITRMIQSYASSKKQASKKKQEKKKKKMN